MAILTGTDGSDTLTAGAGSNTLIGGAGDDVLSSSDQHVDSSLLFGGEGADTLTGGQGSDAVLGGNGDDVILGGERYLCGNMGDDHITLTNPFYPATGSLAPNFPVEAYGGRGDDVIDASAVAPVDIGAQGAAHAYLSGDIGNDTLLGGVGDLTVHGGEGSDSITIDGLNGYSIETFSNQSAQLFGDDGDDVITLRGALVAFVSGGDGDDVISDGETNFGTYIKPGRHWIEGDAGDDRISFSTGGEVLGGEGADTITASGTGQPGYSPERMNLFGNQGDDVIVLDDVGSDFVSVYGGMDNDRIDASAVRNSGVALRGDLGNDVVIGGGAADTLFGGPGSDTLTGGGGVDDFHLGAGNSAAVSAAGGFEGGAAAPAELDRITDFTSGADRLVFDGHATATAASLVTHLNDPAMTGYAAAYAFAYGGAGQAGAFAAAGVAYVVVTTGPGGTGGETYVFAADHAAAALDPQAGASVVPVAADIVGG